MSLRASLHIRRARRESGSAYVIALLALVVLTILGLALALVTQSELQIGSNERVVNRVFYAADSGIGVATARALVAAEYGAKIFTILDATRTGSVALVNEVDVSPFYPIYDAPCNLCEINNAGTYANKAYRKINHAVTSRGTRRGIGPGSSLLADKTITAMVEVQPQPSSTAAYRPINDPAQLAKIKF
jgi:Tfp pilus assembly protein PilX